MINNCMTPKEPINNAEQVQDNNQPSENTGIYVRGFVKISDPETGEVLVETNK